ncbi:Fic family protein [Conchiformibius steedae]|uniref:Fic family protein n=1 Tax=Conchiformibius steedae TaxID=153493 RepID=A0A3P2A2L8_9NEIS|nr:Fic family protein [Conchiformibius steedae]RRD89238.1 Fic family protein [Conchiformibius steedae]
MCRSDLTPPVLFNAAEQQYLHRLSRHLPLSVLLSSARNQEEIGMDFIYHSARRAGCRYDRHYTFTLLKTGRTAAKPFADAVMLLNLWRSYQYLLSCFDDKHTSIRDFIINSHALITQGLPPPHQQNKLVSHHSAHTAAELNRLMSEGQKLHNPFDRALYCYNYLAYGNCFPYGSKRTARHATAFVLMNAGLFPCVFWENGSRDDADSFRCDVEDNNPSNGRDAFIHAYEQTVTRYEPKPDPE